MQIEVRDITKIFGPRPRTWLPKVIDGMGKAELLATANHTLGLKSINLSIGEGQIYVIMGLSGCGKSTLIRHFNRLIDPTAGQILVDGEDIMKLNRRGLIEFRRQRMSMVFQHFGLMPHKTVLENAAFGLAARGVSRKAREEQAMHWLEQVGLPGLGQQYPHQLSGGMRQRVGLARALAMDPDILLMDEAFSALDPLIRREMQDQLLTLEQQLKKTILFITHDLDEALRIGSRIAILKEGELVQEGEPAEILLNPADDYVKAFIRDVNRSNVLTAAQVALQPRVMFKGDESPEHALTAVDSLQVTHAFIVQENRLLGVVSQGDLQRARVEGATSIGGYFGPAETVAAGARLIDVLGRQLESMTPLAVTGPGEEFLGFIPRKHLLPLFDLP